MCTWGYMSSVKTCRIGVIRLGHAGTREWYLEPGCVHLIYDCMRSSTNRASRRDKNASQ